MNLRLILTYLTKLLERSTVENGYSFRSKEKFITTKETPIIKPVIPSYIPMLCPVCRGHKTVNWGKEICSVCNGDGFLKVPPKGEEDVKSST
jgi:hypothetical protein